MVFLLTAALLLILVLALKKSRMLFVSLVIIGLALTASFAILLSGLRRLGGR